VYKFALPIGSIELECIHNRELIKKPEPTMLFYVMSKEFSEKFGIDTELGEVAVYSPNFEKDLSCAWVGKASDFFFRGHERT
jgi:hypothetical protein